MCYLGVYVSCPITLGAPDDSQHHNVSYAGRPAYMTWQVAPGTPRSFLSHKTTFSALFFEGHIAQEHRGEGYVLHSARGGGYLCFIDTDVF